MVGSLKVEDGEAGPRYVSTIVAEALAGSLGIVEGEIPSVNDFRKVVLQDDSGALRAFFDQESARLVAYTYRPGLDLKQGLSGTNDIDSATLGNKDLVVLVGKLGNKLNQPLEEVSSKVSAFFLLLIFCNSGFRFGV